MSQGYKGISFPFRIGVKGGVAMSTADAQGVPHIVESITQILHTRPLERAMEPHIKSEVSTYIFDPNDESTRSLIAYECRKAIEECDDRVEVAAVEVYGEDHTIYATVHFKVKKYEQTYSVSIKVGDY